MYFKYGCVLFDKFQDEVDFFGEIVNLNVVYLFFYLEGFLSKGFFLNGLYFIFIVMSVQGIYEIY